LICDVDQTSVRRSAEEYCMDKLAGFVRRIRKNDDANALVVKRPTLVVRDFDM